MTAAGIKICIITLRFSLNFIRLLRVVITPSVVERRNDLKPSDEFQASYVSAALKDRGFVLISLFKLISESNKPKTMDHENG